MGAWRSAEANGAHRRSTDGIVPPLTPEGRRRAEAYAQSRRGRGPSDSWEDRNLHERCILYHGVPPLPTGYNNNYQIAQNPDFVAIRSEMLNETLWRACYEARAWKRRPLKRSRKSEPASRAPSPPALRSRTVPAVDRGLVRRAHRAGGGAGVSARSLARAPASMFIMP